MNLQQLTTLVTVLNERSMTAAAQKLFLTQPAVSQQIRQLEEELGSELLLRGVRQVTPTPAGKILFDYARRIIYLVKQAEVAVQTVGTDIKGPLRVGTINSVGLHLISPIFGMFLNNNKDVTIKLHYDTGDSIFKLLEAGELDLAILPDVRQEYGITSQGYESQVITTDEFWLVASGQESNIPQQITLSEFPSKPIIWLNDNYPSFANTLTKEFKKMGVYLRPIFETSNVGTIKRVIEAGLGWGFLPSYSVKKQVKSNRMKRVIVEDFNYKLELVCYYPKNLKSNQAHEVFMNSLRNQLSVV